MKRLKLAAIGLGLAPLLLAGPGCHDSAARSAEPSVARGNGFSVPVPARWQIAPKDAPVPPGALMLYKKENNAAGHFHGSMVIVEIGPAPAHSLTELSSCTAIGQSVAHDQHATMRAVTVVDTPAGKSCRLDLAGADNQDAVMFLLQGPKSAWGLTCNHDPRDPDVVADCEAMVAGWKFD